MLSGIGLVAFLTLQLPAASAGQEAFNAEMARLTVDRQFSELDRDDDDLLSEKELEDVPAPELTVLRTNGLSATFPISRDDFVTAGMAVAQAAHAEAAKEPAKEPSKDAMPAAKTPDATSTPGVGRPNSKKGRYVPELPAEYATRDKNGDGQIGLYEWDRKKYSEFARLDKNGDGFLTPAELVSKEVLKAIYARRPKDSKESSDPKAAAQTATTATAQSGSPGSQSRSEGVEAEARGAFSRLDESRDGQLDETEWSRSRNTRQMFESTGTKLTLPATADAFVPLFVRAKSSSTSRQ